MQYDWEGGAELGRHSRRKLKILGDYVFEYVRARCVLPQQPKFTLAIFDGFAGGGRYRCGTAGSPLVFVDALKSACAAINVGRTEAGHQVLSLHCHLFVNDRNAKAVEALRNNLSQVVEQAQAEVPQLQIALTYLNKPILEAQAEVRDAIARLRVQNVLVNLDQYGHAAVSTAHLAEIINWTRSVEIFLTFSIQTLLTFLQKGDERALERQLQHLGVSSEEVLELSRQPTTTQWLGTAERLVDRALKAPAPYASPFAINNPEGWEYWLVHLAKVRRARQVYNDVLHQNADMQAHFGRSGLQMLRHDPAREGQLYLFNDTARTVAVEQLHEDIPRFLRDSGPAMTVQEFLDRIYSETPAHSDDINRVLIDSEEIELITEAGSTRRTPNNIAPTDQIRLPPQTSFHPLWKPGLRKR